ncbi:MAG: EAL domain-containing protein [Nitrospirae bacterium]|nr:EAL domain-containing protein [Nitrospirota bacterium]
MKQKEIQPQEDLQNELIAMKERLVRMEKVVSDHERVAKNLRENTDILFEAQRIARLGNWDWNIETNELHWSQEIYRIFGLTPTEFGATYEAFLNTVHPADREFVKQSVNAALDEKKPYSIDHRIIRPNGEERIVHEQAEVTFNDSGKPVRMVGTVQDITEYKRTESALIHRVEMEKLISVISTNFINLDPHELDRGIQDALEAIGKFCEVDRSYVFLFSEDGTKVSNAHEWCAVGIEPLALRLQDLPVDGAPWFIKKIKNREVVHIPSVQNLPVEASTERSVWQSIGIQSLIAVPMVYSGSFMGWLGFESWKVEKSWSDEDIRLLKMVGEIFVYALERKRVEASLHHIAHYDRLTELPNRTLFFDRLSQELSRAPWRHRLVAVMYLDLDRFQRINDTLGHETGDRLIQAVAHRLKQCVRDGDTVARLGGDEFGLILADIKQEYDVPKVAQKILDSLSNLFALEERELFVTASIGISIHPNDGDEAEVLFQKADTAMSRAKEQGKNNYQLYSPTMNTRAFERLVLETSLRHALEREEFLLHYQPQVDLLTGKVVGMEALVRWQHPDLGLISPVEFIPVLEETGLIVPVGEWILRTASAQNQDWEKAGFTDLRMAVNISPRQFTQKDHVGRLDQILKEIMKNPCLLEFEFTEGIFMQFNEWTVKTLQEWHHMGIHLTIDDFGTGYSSLSYLKKSPIDSIKIDRSFIRDADTNPDDGAIAKAIIAMAHSLRMRVVGEGVETLDQLNFLRENLCDRIQGYYFSRPLPAKEITELLQSGKCLDTSSS